MAEKKLRELERGTRGDDRPIAEMLDRLMDGFKRAGYTLVISNSAWLRKEGIVAQEYIDSKEGKRYRNATLVRLTRGDARVEVSLTDSVPSKFRVETPREHKFLDRIGRSLLKDLRAEVDRQVEQGMANITRLLLT